MVHGFSRWGEVAAGLAWCCLERRRAVVVKQLAVRAPTVTDLKSFDEVSRDASESLRYLGGAAVLARFDDGCNLFLAQGIVLKFLGCLGPVDFRREDIV